MITSDLLLPWFVSQSLFLWVFVTSLAVFHILFLLLFPLSSIGWKKIDYIWLTMSLLGLIGAVGAGRAFIAKNMLEYSKSRIEASFHFMELRAEFGTSNAICRKFIQNDYSPPQEEMRRIQKEYDNQCAWFKKVRSKLLTYDLTKLELIEPIAYFGEPPRGGNEWAKNSFFESVNNFNSTVRAIAKLRSSTELTDFELTLKFLGPFLIAAALALRITKVTGEIHNERKNNNKKWYRRN